MMVKWLLAGFLAVMATAFLAEAKPLELKGRRPNIILVITDDHR